MFRWGLRRKDPLLPHSWAQRSWSFAALHADPNQLKVFCKIPTMNLKGRLFFWLLLSAAVSELVSTHFNYSLEGKHLIVGSRKNYNS